MPAEASGLDRFALPDDDPRRLAERRDLLIDQLAWLVDEAAALGPLLAGLPEWAVSQTALPGERSVKHALARIAALDAGERTQWMRAVEGGQSPDLKREEPTIDEGGIVEEAVGDLLGRLQANRGQLLPLVRGIPAELWSRPLTFAGEQATLYDVIMSIVRDDADELRSLAYRLHDGGVGQRAG